MKTYEITIKPISGFGTPLKGDTLFGHLCWQAAYDETLFGMSLNKLLADYGANPFVIVSSAYPKLENGYALKRPDMPLDKLFDFSNLNKSDIIKKRKEFKSKCWMLLGKDRSLNNLKTEGLYLNTSELFERLSNLKSFEKQREIRKKGIKSFISNFSQSHNTINRLTGTTGEDQFAPYTVEQTVYIPDAELVIFAGLREDIKIENLLKALKRIGKTGFGKDASTGLGRFEVIGHGEINLKLTGSNNPNAYYTLSPVVSEKTAYKKIFFTPFVRFGRHGDILARSKNPFKNPVIMADEGAIFIPHNIDLSKPYIGTAVYGVSKVNSNAVTQGYSLYVPIKVEEADE